MFNKEVYIGRRDELKKRVGNGIIILFGNNDAPCNYLVRNVKVLWAS